MINMTNQQVLNLVGLAYRARRVSLGVETIVSDIQKNQVYFLLIATDIEDNSKKQLIDKCITYDVPYEQVATRQQLGHAIGKQARVAVGIKDAGFAQKFQSLLQK